MPCLKPISIKNPRYKDFDKLELSAYCRDKIGYDNCVYNSLDASLPIGFLPPDYYITVPCGRCVECLRTKRRSWAFRIMNEVVNHKDSTFVTLSLDNENLARFDDEPKKPIKLFIDRLRKALGYRPRYFFVSEYGDDQKYTGRLHYHGIIFGTDLSTCSYTLIRETWNYGISWLERLKGVKAANYCAKYMYKQFGDKRTFMMCSNGIGLSYVSSKSRMEYINNMAFNGYVKVGRFNYPLHRYYTEKFLADNEDLRIAKMINNYTTIREFEFKRQKYTSHYEMALAREQWYQQFNVYYDGYIYNSKTRKSKNGKFQSLISDYQNNDFYSWCPLSDRYVGHSSGRSFETQQLTFAYREPSDGRP